LNAAKLWQTRTRAFQNLLTPSALLFHACKHKQFHPHKEEACVTQQKVRNQGGS
jgi:hypothetical protein